MITLYIEMNVKNKSKYLLTNTIAYNSCVLNDRPAQDFVACIFNRSTCEQSVSHAVEMLVVFGLRLYCTSGSCPQLSVVKKKRLVPNQSSCCGQMNSHSVPNLKIFMSFGVLEGIFCSCRLMNGRSRLARRCHNQRFFGLLAATKLVARRLEGEM